MLIRKTLSLSSVDLKMEGDSGRFTGYASVFGGVDSYGDTIVKGAYESTLRNHGKPHDVPGAQLEPALHPTAPACCPSASTSASRKTITA
jgi:hypothetical protein